MTVICINENWVLYPHNTCFTPEFMKEYEVIDHVDLPEGFGQCGIPMKAGRYYKLAGLDGNRGFHSSNFVSLPEKDADEMREEVRESIVNIETPVV